MILVGLSGYAQSGKDTAADALTQWGYERVSFADTLRAAVYALNPLVDTNDHPYDPPFNVRVQEIIDKVGWDEAKTRFTEIRTLLQKMGTEVGRNLLGENIWVNTALANLQSDRKYVVTDCRFPNEAQAIKDRGGIVLRVARPGVTKANDHPSETSLDDWDFDAILVNDGTVSEFHNKVRRIVNEQTTSRV